MIPATGGRLGSRVLGDHDTVLIVGERGDLVIGAPVSVGQVRTVDGILPGGVERPSDGGGEAASGERPQEERIAALEGDVERSARRRRTSGRTTQVTAEPPRDDRVSGEVFDGDVGRTGPRPGANAAMASSWLRYSTVRPSAVSPARRQNAASRSSTASAWNITPSSRPTTRERRPRSFPDDEYRPAARLRNQGLGATYRHTTTEASQTCDR